MPGVPVAIKAGEELTLLNNDLMVHFETINFNRKQSIGLLLSLKFSF